MSDDLYLHPWNENPRILAEALYGFVPCYSAYHHAAFVCNSVYVYYRVGTSTFDKLLEKKGLHRARWWPTEVESHTPIAILTKVRGRVITEATLLFWGFGVASPGLEKAPDTTLKFAEQDLRALRHLYVENGWYFDEPLLRERLQQLRKALF